MLISPYALIKAVDRSRIFPVNLTQEQIKNSPDIDTDMPVSRQQEIALHRHYPWQTYWGTGFYEGGIWGIVKPPLANPETVGTALGDPHLRSTHAITGYQIETADGETGHLRDFIIDDETWRIEYLVIEIFTWEESKMVIVARSHIRGIQWATSKLLVDLTADELKNSARYTESDLFQEETLDTGIANELHLK